MDQAADFRDYFTTDYGPTTAANRALADQPDRVAALDRDLDALGRRFDLGDGAPLVMDWEYLVITARVR